MFSAAAMPPLTHRLTPAVKAGGFLLTLSAVAAVHLLPLVWLLSADNNVAAEQPSLLTGVLLQRSASQQRTSQYSAPQLRQTIATSTPKTPVAPAKPTLLPPKPIAAIPSEPAAAKPQPTPVSPLTGTPSETLPPPAVAETAAQSDKTPGRRSNDTNDNNDSRAASTEPVSAPLLNASAQNNAPPAYPLLSRKLREQGTVVLALTVLKTGAVADVVLQQSSGYPRLDSAALNAIPHWRYQPAERGGEAIDYRYRQRIEFSLTEGVK